MVFVVKTCFFHINTCMFFYTFGMLITFTCNKYIFYQYFSTKLITEKFEQILFSNFHIFNMIWLDLKIDYDMLKVSMKRLWNVFSIHLRPFISRTITMVSISRWQLFYQHSVLSGGSSTIQKNTDFHSIPFV